MLGFIPLVLFISGAIDSIRNLPTTALFGPTLVFFFLLAGVLFLIPVALVSANLASQWTHKGGIYFWVRKALGPHVGFVAVWLQWINTMVWYPTMLSFIAGILAYLVAPNLADNKLYLVTIILSVFWLLTLLNLLGINISARFAAICSFVGMVIPMLLIITLGGIWLVSGHPLHIHLSHSSVIPSLHHSQSWVSLTAIVTAYLGIELATVHVNHVRNAQRTFPLALMASVVLILTTMILGALAIAYVLPKENISLVTGVMQAFAAFFAAYHMHWMIAVIAFMIFIGSIGSMINWIVSPAKGLLQAAETGFLPTVLQKKNSRGAAVNMLLLQAILVSLVCLVFLFIPSVNGSYWLLTDLSTELYLLMYVLMFIAAIILKYRYPAVAGAFVIPGGKLGTVLVALLGLLGTGLALVVGFFPPENIDVGHHYVWLFSGGLVMMCLPILPCFYYQLRQSAR